MGSRFYGVKNVECFTHFFGKQAIFNLPIEINIWYDEKARSNNASFNTERESYHIILFLSTYHMNRLNIQLLDKLYTKIIADTHFSHFLATHSLKNFKDSKISTLQLMATLITNARAKLEKREGKKTEKNTVKVEGRAWGFGQYKIFQLIVCWYSFTGAINLHDISEEDLKAIRRIFHSKERSFLHYELRLLSLQHQSSREDWSEYEISAFKQVVPSGKLNWKIIAYQHFEQTGKQFVRTPQQCREKWLNTLNPHINKQEWTVKDDLDLIDLIEKEGRKWSLIAKNLQKARTQHMVKNRYYSILRKLNDGEKITDHEYALVLLKAHRSKIQRKSDMSEKERIEEPENSIFIESDSNPEFRQNHQKNDYTNEPTFVDPSQIERMDYIQHQQINDVFSWFEE